METLKINLNIQTTDDWYKVTGNIIKDAGGIIRT